MTDYVYKVQNLSKHYNDPENLVNDNINFIIKRGEIFGLLGNNGAGKTTLIRQMVGLLAISSGNIQLFGESIIDIPRKISHHVGYMPQESDALNNLSVQEALYFSAHLRGLNKKDAREEVHRLIELWDMKNIQNQYSSRLSGGQKRLLRLAVAMAGNPPVLILDEPTNDLDPERRKLVWDVLQHINEQYQSTIIFVTHDAIEAEKVIQRVGIMANGCMVAIGKPNELKQNITNKFRLDLFYKSLPIAIQKRDKVISKNGYTRILVNWEELPQLFRELNQNRSDIDDIKLLSATLEDLYFHYVYTT